MKMPNFASRYHSGTGRLSSEGQFGSYGCCCGGGGGGGCCDGGGCRKTAPAADADAENTVNSAVNARHTKARFRCAAIANDRRRNAAAREACCRRPSVSRSEGFSCGAGDALGRPAEARGATKLQK